MSETEMKKNAKVPMSSCLVFVEDQRYFSVEFQ